MTQNTDFRSSLMLSRISVSPTMAITQAARVMRAQGRNVISLSVGEPDFDTPTHVCDAAIAAIRAGQTRYTAADGTPELKAAIREKFQRDQKTSYRDDEVTATSGGKFLIYAAILATVNVGDEVIIPAPYWVSYPDIARMAGGTPVVVETPQANDFLMTADQLRAAITTKTRWLILNSPGNPTGAVYGQARLEQLAEVLRDHPWVDVMVDDIYEHICFDGSFVSLVTVAPDLKDRILIVNGAAKAYAMTGWRLGFGAGPAPLIAAIRKILGQTTSNPCSIAQAAGVAALRGDHGFLSHWVATYRRRRDFVVAAINAMDGLSCVLPSGAFYVFPSCAGLIGKRHGDRLLENDVDIAAHLLDVEGVATVPGTAFGLGPHLRLSYATDDQSLIEALRRIGRFTEACV